MMDRYPALRFIVRFGHAGAPVVALLAGVFAWHLARDDLGPYAAVVALAVFALTYLLARAFVEIVIILTEMLVPR